ncbi:hypothetical protein FHL15_010160 [Xylaria flabelliformis]|uniref:Uncharacterized protein n=1 Tax=Xylaria flabelliformis TaxID=2512241 RepID=A0A553HLU6_9PEZI|nr:hypothetical protein FHL15_010160 [Xylaria flabelliformis]
MAPNYQLYSSFAVKDALAAAGAPKYKSEFQEGEPPVEFFIEVPKNSTAVFSTLFATRPFRLVENPTREREGHYWWAAEIQRVCDELRRNLPDVCKRIETPRSYWDLYKYFDAYDIYYRGAQNLWNVINTLVFENEYAQRIVENEQKMDIERFMPLFEHLASELLRRPGIQTKLLTWDRKRQQDVLKVLTAYELQTFEGYEKYPDHFLGAIRAIFIRCYENFHKGTSSLASYLAPISGPMPNFAALKELASLRGYLQSIAISDDPFMDKFAIPNKIINGIVIVDGTSETAARKARQEAAIASHKLTRPSVVQGNGAHGPSPPKWVPINDASPLPLESSGTTHRVSIAERYLSAPSIGGDPAHILSDPVAEEARVYPGGNHEVDKKLMGCPKPTSPEDTGDRTSGAANVRQNDIPTSNSRLPQVLTNNCQSLPNHYQGDHDRFSPVQQRTLPPTPNFVPDAAPPHQGSHDRDMSRGLFAHQIPPYAIKQPHVEGPPPMLYPHPAHIRAGYTTHVDRHYSQVDPPAVTNSSEGSGQHNSDPSTRNYSSGKWQQIGSDDIHGPKAIFRRGSAHDDRIDQNHRVGQWQRKESNNAGRRTSFASNNGNYRRFTNSHTQQFTIHTGPHQTDKNLSITGGTSGHISNEVRCVNAGKPVNIYTKFDPCFCSKCSERDRTIFVNRLREGINQTEGALERLKLYFSKFGSVDSVTSLTNNLTCVHVKSVVFFDIPAVAMLLTDSGLHRFASVRSAIAAVRAEPEVQLNDLGDKPLKVQFRTGSQFFAPLVPYHARHFTNVRDYRTHDARVMMPQPPVSGSNNTRVHVSWSHPSLPGQQTISPGGVPFEGHPPGADFDDVSKHAGDQAEQTSTQSEREITETRRLSYSKMTSPVITPHPIHGLVVVDAKDTCGMAGHGGKHIPRFDGILSSGNSQGSIRDTANLAHDLNTSHRATIRTTPDETAKPDDSPPQAAITPSNSQDILAQVPENDESAKPDEELSIDYGTVRIRPGKARYMAIPQAWRQESTPPQDQRDTGSQYLEIASQCGLAPIAEAARQPSLPSTKNYRETESMEHLPKDATARPLHESDRNKMSAEDELLSGHHDSASSHVKRKASETERSEKAPDQLSPKKKSSRISQPTDSGHQQHEQQQAGETGKTKKKKKNKHRQNQSAQPVMPGNSSTTVPFAAQTFQPAIPSSFLPPYPPQQISRRDVSHISEPVYVRVPPTPPRFTNRLEDSEPFPAYRDLMSGPQFPLRGHRSHASESGHNRSISSNASTVINICGFSPKSYRLNPGAQNFVPGPADPGHRDSILTLNPQAFTTLCPQEGSHTFHSPGHPVQVTQEAPQSHTQTGIQRSDSNMSVLGQRVTQTPTSAQLSTKNNGEKENSKGTHSKNEAAPQAIRKDENASKTSTNAKQGGGKGKGKSKNAKACRNDQKNAVQPPVDRKGKSTEPAGLKNPVPKKVEARYAEVLKQNLPTSAAGKQHTVVEARLDESSKQSGTKGINTDQQEKGKGKEVSEPERKPIAKGVETTTATAETKPKNDQTDDKVHTCSKSPVDPGTAKTSETKPLPTTCAPGPSTTSTSTPTPKPKQGKAKNRAPAKKGVVGTQQHQQQPPIAGPSTTTMTNASPCTYDDGGGDEDEVYELSRSLANRSFEYLYEEELLATASMLGTTISEKKPSKPRPALALAPIPLCGPWRTVAGKKAGGNQAQTQTQTQLGSTKDVVKDDEETPLPVGERKGG